MSLLDNLVSSMGTGVVQQLTKQFGIDGNQATSALSTLIPVLAGGLKDKVAGSGGAGLLDLVTGNTFQQFANDPVSLGSPAAVQQGNSLLAQIFGGTNALSDITTQAAEKTGLGGPLLRSMLPVVASLLMGLLSKKAAGDATSATDMLTSLAEPESGGVVGAIKSLASKMFG
jgi:hypothetical protein